jgi:hypothetical protein
MMTVCEIRMYGRAAGRLKQSAACYCICIGASPASYSIYHSSRPYNLLLSHPFPHPSFPTHLSQQIKGFPRRFRLDGVEKFAAVDTSSLWTSWGRSSVDSEQALGSQAIQTYGQQHFLVVRPWPRPLTINNNIIPTIQRQYQ